MKGLRGKAYRSLIWSGAGQYSTQALSLLTAAVLGRLLDPSDFGLVGMILAANAFLIILSNAGISSTAVQFKDLTKNDFRAMQGLALAVGILSAGLPALSAPWISAFFREPRLENIAYAWTPALLFTALAQVPQGMLRRDFLYARRRSSSGSMKPTRASPNALKQRAQRFTGRRNLGQTGGPHASQLRAKRANTRRATSRQALPRQRHQCHQ